MSTRCEFTLASRNVQVQKVKFWINGLTGWGGTLVEIFVMLTQLIGVKNAVTRKFSYLLI